MPPGDAEGRFAVHTPPHLLKQLRDWAAEASAMGRRAEYLDALRQVNEQLETNPHDWGDLLREYVVIDAVERRGLAPKWILVWYGVHDNARQVVVRSLLPAPGSSLSTPKSG